MRIGVISDTHGYFNSKVREVLAGVELILHAGDIGALRVVTELERIAPVVAVHGNMDRGATWQQYPLTRVLRLGDLNLLLVHRVSDGLAEIARRRGNGANGRIDVLVYGHTHRVENAWRDGMLYFNPGLGGLPRNYQSATVGILTLEDGEARGEVVNLDWTIPVLGRSWPAE